jgi:hypothetical protein
MGMAIPVIALAISAAGTAASIAAQSSSTGTNYVADSKAKYQADQEALKLAEYTAEQKQTLIDEEKASAQAFAKVSHEQTVMQLNAASESAALELEQQWQSVNYNKAITDQTQAMEKFMSNASLESSRQAADTTYQNAKNQVGIENLSNKASLAASQTGYDLKDLAIQNQQLSNTLSGANINLSQDNANLTNRIEQQNIGLAQNKLGLSNASLDQQTLEAQQGINTQTNQADLTEQSNKQGAFEQGQKLNSAESQNNAQLNLSMSAADNQKRQDLNKMLLVFAGNEQDYAKYQAKLQAMGLQTGGTAQFDQTNNLQNQMSQQDALSTSSNAKTQAGITNQYAQGQVQQGRASLEAQTGLNKQAMNLTRSQIAQSQSNLNTNSAISRAGLSQDQQALNLKQGNLNLAQTQSDQSYNLQRQQLGVTKQETMLAKYQTDLDREYDVFSKSLLPDLKSQQVLEEANQSRVQSLFGINLQQTGEDFASDTQKSVQDTQYGIDQQAYKSGLEEIPTNYAYNRKAEDASYLSSLGSSSTQAEAALASLASSQYGTLSTIGNNLSNGTTTGYVASESGASKVASALNSVGGFMSSLQGYLGTRNTSSSSK